ncbi:MAG TPA: flagellar biosynthetic protein FliQ [Oligoflexia bacterium]|nr:flagellar biosynthetic protein FliQ [Oligoflexia bacterium]HMP48779.1 flagellar biosynthetic protein FliQ [Oligoflexia bacterium]
MDIEGFSRVASLGIQTAMLVSAPVLICGLTAGIAVSVFQAATQINDAALAFIPKIAAAVGALMVFGPWMSSKMTTFAIYAFEQIGTLGTQ